MNNDPKCIVILDDQQQSDDCNNRISFLRSLRFCQLQSKMCNQPCRACQKHGDEHSKMDHKKVSVQDFQHAFAKLEETCSRETQHYIRQMNQTQKKAIDMIGKKKQEYFQQIEELKVHLMKKTYLALEEKYPTLYQKYRNSRFDTLKCCQVFWVLDTHPSRHPVKHSQLNKKLEAILKKFQNYKQVSRNIKSENIFDIKQKVKKGKLIQKMTVPERTKEKEQGVKLSRERVNYQSDVQDRYKGEIDKLSRELVAFRQKKKEYEQDLRQLQHQVNYFTIKKSKLMGKLELKSKVVNFHSKFYQNIARKEQTNNKTPIVIPEEEELQMESQMNEADIEIELHPNQMEVQEEMKEKDKEEHNLSAQKQAEINNEEIMPEHGQEDLHREPQGKPEQNESIVINQEAIQRYSGNENNDRIQNQPERQQNHKNEGQVRPQKTQMKGPLLQVNQPEKEPGQLSQQSQQKVIEDGLHSCPPQQPENRPVIDQLAKPTQQQNEVKIEASAQAYEPWKNDELLRGLRESGNRVENGLKVQYIDVLSELPFINPPKDYFKMIPSPEKAGKNNESDKPSKFNIMADKLFMKYGETKKGQEKDRQ